MRRRRQFLIGSLGLAALAAACTSRAVTEPPPPPRPTRGYVLLSIDTLRADALGVYGSQRPTTPFLDRLAARAVIFENAFAQVPSTLPSHMSMFTGLYPSEHDVQRPNAVLAEEIPTLPELFRASGFRTFGHSEGGWMKSYYGFARGFEEWTDRAYTTNTDVERTLGRGLESLARLAPGERFFLFLHTYSVHDPYEPPPGYRGRFWPGPPPAGAFAAQGPNFSAHNGHLLDAPPAAREYFRALYDEGVRYLDDMLSSFFAELERRGLADDTTFVLTSDHGEEFLEHGRYAHSQAYPESLHVPLLVVHPDLGTSARVLDVVETIDLLPTLAELSGVATPASLSGRSLVPLVTGGGRRLAGRAYAQNLFQGVGERTVIEAVDGRLLQLHVARPRLEQDGFWVSRELRFDASSEALELRAVAYHEPRRVAVLADGEQVAELEVGTDWTRFQVPFPSARPRRITLRTDACESPARLGLGTDTRCHSFKLDGLQLSRVELFDLSADPFARHDFALERPPLVRRLAQLLRLYPETPRSAADAAQIGEEQIRHLKALGYLQ